MTALVGYYSRYVGRHQGHLPPDEAALKSFIRSEAKGGPYLRAVRRTLRPSIISSGTAKPLVITYGNCSRNREFTPELIVAHEQVGVEGKRLAAFPIGAVRELDGAALGALEQGNRI